MTDKIDNLGQSSLDEKLDKKKGLLHRAKRVGIVLGLLSALTLGALGSYLKKGLEENPYTKLTGYPNLELCGTVEELGAVVDHHHREVRVRLNCKDYKDYDLLTPEVYCLGGEADLNGKNVLIPGDETDRVRTLKVSMKNSIYLPQIDTLVTDLKYGDKVHFTLQNGYKPTGTKENPKYCLSTKEPVAVIENIE